METKKAKVIKLPTRDATPIIFKDKDHDYYQQYHLYFITDDEIKKDDWYLNLITSNYYKWDGVEDLDEHEKKIVATTDFKLTKGELWSDKGFPAFRNIKLPHPTKDFIEAYCRQGGIDFVLIELEEC